MSFVYDQIQALEHKREMLREAIATAQIELRGVEADLKKLIDAESEGERARRQMAEFNRQRGKALKP